MLLEHNTYKEAISDIRLSEERGMEMMENTMKRKEKWSQKWKVDGSGCCWNRSDCVERKWDLLCGNRNERLGFAAVTV